MRQLAETGYMSNRGRQLVASCLVHELRQDWRYGAAWFEHQLIDYDVGVIGAIGSTQLVLEATLAATDSSTFKSRLRFMIRTANFVKSGCS